MRRFALASHLYHGPAASSRRIHGSEYVHNGARLRGKTAATHYYSGFTTPAGGLRPNHVRGALAQLGDVEITEVGRLNSWKFCSQ